MDVQTPRLNTNTADTVTMHAIGTAAKYTRSYPQHPYIVTPRPNAQLYSFEIQKLGVVTNVHSDHQVKQIFLIFIQSFSASTQSSSCATNIISECNRSEIIGMLYITKRAWSSTQPLGAYVIFLGSGQTTVVWRHSQPSSLERGSKVLHWSWVVGVWGETFLDCG